MDQRPAFSTNEQKELINFGFKLRSLRDFHEWSQEKLGEKADLHRTTIGAIERGETNIGLLTINKLARALMVSTSRLLS